MWRRTKTAHCVPHLALWCDDDVSGMGDDAWVFFVNTSRGTLPAAILVYNVTQPSTFHATFNYGLITTFDAANALRHTWNTLMLEAYHTSYTICSRGEEIELSTTTGHSDALEKK